MSNDIAKYVEQIVSKLTGNNSLIEKFKANPAKIVTDLLGIKLEDHIIIGDGRYISLREMGII